MQSYIALHARTAAHPEGIAFILAEVASPISPISPTFSSVFATSLVAQNPHSDLCWFLHCCPQQCVGQTPLQQSVHASADLLFPTTSIPFVDIEALSVLAHLRAFVADTGLLDVLRVPASNKKDRAGAGPTLQELVPSSHLRASSALAALQKGTTAEDCVLVPLTDRKSTRLNSSHSGESRMPSSA